MIERIVYFQPRTIAQDNYLSATGEEQRWAPWAALVLAPIIKTSGLAVELVDARTEPTTWEQRLSTLGPSDLLAVSVMTGNAIRDAITASKHARARGSKVIWGGPHVSLFPYETI